MGGSARWDAAEPPEVVRLVASLATTPEGNPNAAPASIAHSDSGGSGRADGCVN